MCELWNLARCAWPGSLPVEQPDGVLLTKTRLPRCAVIQIKPGALAVVLSGRVAEWMYPYQRRACIVREYRPREPIAMLVGELRADVQTDLLIFSPGWEEALPDALALVRMLRDAEANELKSRLAVVMCMSVQERVRRYVQENDISIDTVKRQRLAHLLGASREMVSITLSKMVKETS